MLQKNYWLWLVIVFSLIANLIHTDTLFAEKKRGRLFAPPPQEPASDSSSNTPKKETPSHTNKAKKQDYPSHGIKDQEEEFAESNFPKSPTANSHVEEETTSDSPFYPRKLGIGGGVSLASGFFGANLQLLYYTKSWLAWDLHYAYLQQQSDSWTKKEHEPGVGLRLSYPNSTLLTPFVGAGPGYVFWNSTWSDKKFLPEKKQSLTLNYSYGVWIYINKYIGVELSHRFKNYLEDPPKKLSDPSRLEEKNQSQISIGFTFQMETKL